jgi:hypothetical protein
MQRWFNRATKEMKHPPMLKLATMMSRTVLCGMRSPNTSVFVPIEKLCSVFPPSEGRRMQAIHYADYYNVDVENNLRKLRQLAGPHVNAFQLDMTFPQAEDIRKGLKASGPPQTIILQIGEGCFNLVGNDPRKLCCMLEPYAEIVHRILLDRSMGRGKPLNSDELSPFIKEILGQGLPFEIGVAGGLRPDNVIDRFGAVCNEFKQFFSSDTESGIRQSGKRQDPVNWLIAACQVEKLIEISRAMEVG